MQSLGHKLEESHPAALDEPNYVHWFNIVVSAHTVAAIDQIGTLLGRAINAEDVESWTWRLIERGRQISAGEYLGAIAGLQVWTRRMAQWWAGDFDLLLTPTIAQPPPALGTLVMTPEDPDRGWQRLTELIQFTPAYNATGQPAISLPLHWNDEGLPIGIQLVAAFGREDLLIQAAAQLEEAHPWKDRKPPVCA